MNMNMNYHNIVLKNFLVASSFRWNQFNLWQVKKACQSPQIMKKTKQKERKDRKENQL